MGLYSAIFNSYGMETENRAIFYSILLVNSYGMETEDGAIFYSTIS